MKITVLGSFIWSYLKSSVSKAFGILPCFLEFLFLDILQCYQIFLIHRLNLERLNLEWDFCPNGLNPEWDWPPNGTEPQMDPTPTGTQPRIDSTPNGTQPRMDLTPTGTQLWMDSTSNRLYTEWDLTPNGTQPWVDSTPNGTQPRMDLTAKWDSTQNGLNTEWEDSTSIASQPLNGTCFFIVWFSWKRIFYRGELRPM